MKTRLIISIPIEAETEEEIIKLGKEKVNKILNSTEYSSQGGKEEIIPDDSQFSLTRDGDRSALNLLLPKTEGRFGNHYQGRKATKKELM